MNRRRGVRHRVIAGRLVDIPEGACAYCHACDAKALHCMDCGRHIGAQKMHIVHKTGRVQCPGCFNGDGQGWLAANRRTAIHIINERT